MKTVILTLALFGLLLIVGGTIAAIVVIVPLIGKSVEKQYTETDYQRQDDPPYRKHVEQAARDFDNKDYAAAEAALDKALELSPDNASLLYSRALCRHNQNKMQGALDDLDQAIKLDAEQPNYFNLRGYVYVCLGRYQDAIEDMSKSLVLDPNKAMVYRSRGLAYYCKGDNTEALSDYRQSYALSSPGVDAAYAHYFMWCVQAKQGKLEEATKALVSFLEQPSSKKMESWAKSVGEFLVDETSETQLLKIAEAASDPDTVRNQQCEAYFYIAIRRLASGNKAGAREYLQKCIDTNVFLFLEFEMAKADMRRLEM